MTERQNAPFKLELPEKPSLEWILQALDDMNDGLIDASIEELQSMTDLLEGKIDGYEAVIDRLEADSARLKARAQRYAAAAKVSDNKIQRLKDMLVFSLRSRGINKFSGNEHSVRLIKSERVKVSAEATLDLYSVYPSYMRMKFEWDLPRIKTALKAGCVDAAKIAVVEDSFSPKFEVLKG